MRKVRVAYLLHGLGIGGASTSMLLLLKSMKQLNYYKVGYYASDGSMVAKENYLSHLEYIKRVNIEHIYNDAGGAHTPEERFIKIISKSYVFFVEELQNNEIDILHINSSVLPQIHKIVKENSDIKIVTHVREMIPKYENGLVQDFMISQINKYSDAIITISDNEAKAFPNHKNLHIISNPFDFSEISSIKTGLFRKKYNIDNNVVLVGMSGKFKESKGQMLFIKALHEIEKRDFPIELKFVIMGAQFNPLWKVVAKRVLNRYDFGYEFKKYLRKNKLNKNLILLPYQYNFFENLIDMDIIVRPSLAGDPWGRDIIESMAFKKPIIATGSSGYYVNPGINGYFVANNDPIALTERIIELAGDKEKRIQFGNNSYKTVFEKCNINNYAKKIDEVYKSILE